MKVEYIAKACFTPVAFCIIGYAYLFLLEDIGNYITRNVPAFLDALEYDQATDEAFHFNAE